ncbi:MAG: radical SAM protein [Planctomycetes bacterium]|nr:radical SAM protein [Planctomycetota bacterium]
MELHIIPFEGQFIIYRPLISLAFLGNAAMARHVEERVAGRRTAGDGEPDLFLQEIGFWRPDPAAPALRASSAPHRPTIAVLLMTSDCNLRCVYCYARGGEDPRLAMTVPMAKAVIDTACDNARAAGQDHFELAFHGGGEPTIAWETMTVAVEHARAKDVPCHIAMATNGVWSDQKREFILQHFDALSVSMDGVAAVQDAQRPRAGGGGSFESVMKTLRALDQASFRYGIRLTTTPASFGRLAESVAFLIDQTGCRIIQVEPCYSTKRGEYAGPTGEEGETFTRAFLEAFQIAAASGRTLFYSGARPWVIGASFCRAAEDALVATPEGDLVTCFEAHDRRHPLLPAFLAGRMSSAGPEIDRGKIAAFTESLRRRREACEGCFARWHCAGDCASRCLASADENRGRCQVNRDITRELLAWYIAAGNGVWRGERPDLPLAESC